MSAPTSLERRSRGRPAASGRPFADTRNMLIRHGTEMLTERGINATTVEEVLKAAQVPKGSFYHYFASKETFVVAALDAYADYFAGKLQRHFSNTALTPLERLGAFVDDACAGMERYAFQRGCLVGNLGQEVSYLDEKLRLRLEQTLVSWERALESCLASAMSQGQLSPTANCAALAHAFWVGWEGAILRARLARSTAPMRAFFQFYLSGLPTR